MPTESAEEDEEESTITQASDDEEQQQGEQHQWIPPGQGSRKTRNKNRRRRQKERQIRAAEWAATKRHLAPSQTDPGVHDGGGEDLEPTVEEGEDDNGEEEERYNRDKALKRPRVLFVDDTLEENRAQVDKVQKLTQENVQDSSTPSTRYASQVNAILPPSQRGVPLPPGLRLTRVDCDECMTPWPEEVETTRARSEASPPRQEQDLPKEDSVEEQESAPILPIAI